MGAGHDCLREIQGGLDEHKTHLMVRYFALRPQVLVELYVQADLWRAYLAKRKQHTNSEY